MGVVLLYIFAETSQAKLHWYDVTLHAAGKSRMYVIAGIFAGLGEDGTLVM